jgi:hypothetical protein
VSTVRSFFRSFSGGVVTPEFWGQIADPKFQTGLATCRNFRVLPHGPVENRPGLQFVRKAKLGDTGVSVRLIPFEFSSDQTLVLEFGAGYIRFHTLGATVESTPGTAYEVATTYAQADLAGIKIVQSADVLTLVHPNHPVRELRRLAATNWQLVDVTFAPTLPAPASPGAVATTAPSPSNTRSYSYVVTSINDDSDESAASASASCTNNLDQTGAYNSVSWTAASGATRYAVYRCDNGSTGPFGYVGASTGTSFRDDNITPDLTRTPPSGTDPFTGAGNYPGAVSYFEQRRIFAGTTNKPQNFWGTRTGTEKNLNSSVPPRDNDAITFRIAARQVSRVLHIVPLTSLVLLTGSTEFRVVPPSGVLSPAEPPSVLPQSYVGASNVQPLVVNNNILFGAARGGHLREMAYNDSAGGYLTGDLSLRAPHLFDNKQITGMAYAKAPVPTAWCVSSDGSLLGLTYVPEQQIGAWHAHDTGNGDEFLDVCAVAEGNEDAVYVAVRRTVDGAARTYIERFAPRFFSALEDAVFVDSSLTYRGAPATTISGLGHLEGRTVSILADGGEHPQRVVTGGQVALDEPASVVTVGLPIEADIQSLPLVIEGMSAFGQGRVKNVNKVLLRVYRSSGVSAGPRFDKLTEFKQRANESMGTAPDLVTDEISIVVSPAWQNGGQVCVRQSAPLPLTIVAMAVEADAAG